MSRRIDYYFSLLSPWAYIGDRFFIEIARRHAARVVHKPVLLNEVFSQTAAVSGSATYVPGGGVSWGHDRLDLLQQALTRRAAPFSPRHRLILLDFIMRSAAWAVINPTAGNPGRPALSRSSRCFLSLMRH